MAFDPSQPFEVLDEEPKDKPPFDPSKPSEPVTEAPAATATKPPFDPTQPTAPVSDQDLINDDTFDPASHAAQNPDDFDLAFRIDQARRARPLGEKAAEFAETVATPATWGHAVKGVVNFLTGFPQVATNTVQAMLPDAVLRTAKQNPTLTRMATMVNPWAGQAMLDAPAKETLQAEATLTGQHGEEAIKRLGRILEWGSKPLKEKRTFRDEDGNLIEDTGEELKPVQSKEDAKREYFQRLVEAAKNQIALSQGQPLETGPIAELYRLAGSSATEEVGPKELKRIGAEPVSQERIERMAAATDPLNIALAVAPSIPGARTIGGAATEAAGKAITGAGKVVGATTNVATSPLRMLRRMADPASAAASAATEATAQQGARGLQALGDAIAQQGKEMRTGVPSALTTKSATATAAGERALGTDALRKTGDVVAHGAATAAGIAPLNVALSEGDPRQLAELQVGAGVFGAALGGLRRNRSMLVEGVRPHLRSEGARALAEAGEGNDTLATRSARFVMSLPEAARDRVLETIGALQGLPIETANGRQRAKVYVLSEGDYLAAQRNIMKGMPGAEGGGRGFFNGPDGAAYINGEYHTGLPASELVHTVGHEFGGHAAISILQAVGSRGGPLYDGMMNTARKALYIRPPTKTKPGIPTPEFRKFVEGYNRAFDPTGKTKQIDVNDIAAVDEFISETAGQIMAGRGPGELAIPLNIQDKIAGGVADFMAKTIGMGGKNNLIGSKTNFDRTESAEVTRTVQEVLSELVGMKLRDGMEIPEAEKTVATRRAELTEVLNRPAPPDTAPLSAREQWVAERKAAQKELDQLMTGPKPKESDFTEQPAGPVDNSMTGMKNRVAATLRTEGVDATEASRVAQIANGITLAEMLADARAKVGKKQTPEINIPTALEPPSPAAAIKPESALKIESPADVTEGAIAALMKMGIGKNQAKALVRLANQQHGSPIMDTPHLAAGAFRIHGGGSVKSGEWIPKPAAPKAPVTAASGMQFRDEAGNTKMVVSTIDSAPQVGDVVMTRDGELRRVTRSIGDTIDTARTIDPLTTRGTKTHKLDDVAVVTHDYAPESTAAGTVAPPAPPQPKLRVEPRGDRFIVVDEAGNNATKTTYASQRDAEAAIAKTGKPSTFDIPKSADGNDVIDAILENGGMDLSGMSKEESENVFPHRGIWKNKLITGNRNQPPDEMARILLNDYGIGDGDARTMFDLISQAITARKSLRLQTKLAERAEKGKAPTTSNEPAPTESSEPPPTEEVPGKSTLTANDTKQSAPAPEPARLSPADVDRIAAQAEAEVIAARAGTKKKESTLPKEISDAQIDAVADAHEQGLPANYQGVRLRTDAMGKKTITGTFNPSRPFDAFLLKLADLSETAVGHLQALQQRLGQTVTINYSHAPEREGIATGEGRRSAQKESTAQARASGEAEAQAADKNFIPLEVRFNKGKDTPSITVLGASPEKLLNNFNHAKKALQEFGEPVPYRDIHDPHLVGDMKGVARNHANGWKGDGSARIEGFPDVNVPTPEAGYKPYEIPADRFDFLNLILGQESAKTGVKGISAEQKLKQGLAVKNRIPMTEAGETNLLREAINRGKGEVIGRDGKPTTWSKATLEDPMSEALRIDLVNEVKPATENTDASIRPHGYKGEIDRFFAEGSPNRTFSAAGFMPETPRDKARDRMAREHGAIYQGVENGLAAFKDEQTGGNFSLPEKDITSEAIKAKVDDVRKNFEGDQIDTPEKLEKWMRDQGLQFMPAQLAGTEERPAAMKKRALKLWVEQGTDSPFFQKWFSGSKVVDESGKPRRVFHGSRRADRIDTFKAKRATSGPMAFFSDDPMISSNYATSKQDTSLEAPSDYAGWFKFKDKGMRTPMDIDRAWYALTPEQRSSVLERIYTIGHENHDQAEGPIVPNSQSIMGKDGIDYELRQARGNGLRALVEIWLNSGSLFNDEEQFMDVLKSAGVPMEKVSFESPWKEVPGVLPVYLSIRNPLDTANIPESVLQALENAGKRKRSKTPAGGNSDAWDKNTISGPEWIAALREDAKNGTTYAWTRIPDWATETLTRLGYDGVKDTGGKMGGQSHGVWIPFRENQVKSATGNQGTFDPSNPDMRFMPASTEDIGSIGERYRDRLDTRAFLTKSGGNDIIKLDHIQAKKSAPAGTGSDYMRELVKYADDHGLTIALQTATKGDLDSSSEFKKTSSQSRLKEFYSRFGFKSNYGKRSYRADLPGNMHREPKTTKAMPSDRERTMPEGFYSGLQRTLEEKMPNSAPAAQVLAIARGGAKAEELKWTDLDGAVKRIAAENGGKVPKQALLDHLATDGAVRFKEVKLSDSKTASDPDLAKKLSEAYAERNQWRDMMEAKLGDPRDWPPAERKELSRRTAEIEELEKQRNEDSKSQQDAKPKFSQYTLPGGKNYREIVLTMEAPNQYAVRNNKTKEVRPFSTKEAAEKYIDQNRTSGLGSEFTLIGRNLQETAQSFTSSHFPNAGNYVAHMRLADHVDAQGREGTLIEENQSDRHQQGREKGYRDDARLAEITKDVEATPPNDWGQIANPNFEEQTRLMQAIPDAPLRKTWHEYQFRRALQDAIATGKEWIGWTTGDTQAERYDLSKQVDRIDTVRNKDGTYYLQAIEKGNRAAHDLGERIPADKLADFVGKELAQKIIDQPRTVARFEGADLKVGGEGMKGFYDKIMPSYVSNYVKKWGGKVEQGRISTGAITPSDTSRMGPAEAEAALRKADQTEREGVEIWKVDITPEMREAVKKGQPMFMPDAQPVETATPARPDARQNARSRIAAASQPETVQMSNASVTKGPSVVFLPAYHGTPHKVDKFSLEKVGTGEGAQAYGWGLYFAENPKVAEQYQKELAQRAGASDEWFFKPTEEGKAQFNKVINFADAAPMMASQGMRAMNIDTVKGAVAKLREMAKPGPRAASEHYRNAYAGLADMLEAGTLKFEKPSGNKYTVDIDVQPNELLDWDNHPPDSVKQAISGVARGKHKEAMEKALQILSDDPSTTGQQFYKLVAMFLTPKQASEALREAGIVGIQYLDQGSRVTAPDLTTKQLIASLERNKGDIEASLNDEMRGVHAPPKEKEKIKADLRKTLEELSKPQTRNLVIFDDNRIRITHENGEPVTPKERREALGQKISPKDAAKERLEESLTTSP
jgi:hypothetical protein